MPNPETTDQLAELRHRLTALHEALTPSAGTKAAYIGEFTFPFTADLGDDGEETINMTVPWTTIKEIMAAIIGRAAIASKDTSHGR